MFSRQCCCLVFFTVKGVCHDTTTTTRSYKQKKSGFFGPNFCEPQTLKTFFAHRGSSSLLVIMSVLSYAYALFSEFLRVVEVATGNHAETSKELVETVL